MATNSNILTWRILWTEEPSGLLSMGSHRVRQNWSDLPAAAACKIDSQWEFPVWNVWELKQGLCDRLKGEVGRGMGGESGREGTWVYLWLILVDVWQKTIKFCKAIILQLKIEKNKTKNQRNMLNSLLQLKKNNKLLTNFEIAASSC